MYRIAICDDEPSFCRLTQTILSTHPKRAEMIVEEYHSCTRLADMLKLGRQYDLLILDIELPDMNGIEMGEFVRNKMRDSIIQILYVSAKDGYDRRLFEFRPLNFLKKPINAQKLLSCVDQAMSLSTQEGLFFSFQQERTIRRLPLRSVVYFASNKRKLVVYTSQQSYEFYGKLDALKLPSDFMRIHKSIIVNCNYVKAYQYDKLTLDSERVFPISRTYQNQVRDQMFARLETDLHLDSIHPSKPEKPTDETTVSQ